ncbi:MAG: response regulator [Tatlockia sp.]|nr:response regulator [Tatlockia sp.]
MKKRILIVEDDNIAMTVHRILMEELDCQVDCVTSGEMAINSTQNNQYDLILMDLGLPGIDGIETARKIRLFENENHKNIVPIVAVTGNADPSQQALCMDAGMNDVIEKPLTLDIAKSIISTRLA